MTDSFAIRNSSFGLPQVRHSNFVIRHCPAPHDATGRFDFVLANPPFNVNAVDKERLKDMVGPGRRFPFGQPRTDNANYLWIQLFHSALNEKGRAGFVMANDAENAHSFCMNIAADVRKCALEQDLTEKRARKKGIGKMVREFAEKGAAHRDKV